MTVFKGDYPDTCFLGATIMECVEPEMRIVKEEIFGPTMGVLRVKTLDEAIQICNENPYHNADAIFTSNGRSAREFKYSVISGNVGINVGIVAPMAFFPFSGIRDSFFGILHTQGKEAIRFFTAGFSPALHKYPAILIQLFYIIVRHDTRFQIGAHALLARN